jgi:hypothetical protein
MELKRKRLLLSRRRKGKKKKMNKNPFSLTSSAFLMNRIGMVSPKRLELLWKSSLSYF